MTTLFFLAGFLLFVFPAAAQTDTGNNVGIATFSSTCKPASNINLLMHLPSSTVKGYPII